MPEKIFEADVIEVLRKRIAKTSSQRQFAETAGIPPTQLSMVMTGKKSLTVPHIRNLHRVYGIPLKVLLSPTPHEIAVKILRQGGKAK